MAREHAVAPVFVVVLVLAGAVGPGVAAQADVAPADTVNLGSDATDQPTETVLPTTPSIDVQNGPGPARDAVAAPPATPGTAIDAQQGSDSAAEAGRGADATTDVETGVHERIVLRQDDERGYFEVTYEYDLSAGVSSLNVTVPFEYQFVEAAGFERLGSSEVRWTDDAGTTTPSVTFRVIADVGGRSGSFQFVDAGDWALVRTPNRTLHWSSEGGPLGVETTYEVEGPGAVGSDIAYLGPHEEYVAESEDERIRLVVPSAADLADPPGEIVDTLARASDELDVGGTSDEVLVVAAPTGNPDWVEWAALGIQRGSSDAWVRDDVPLAHASSTWLHEYVHTRQTFETDADFETEWLVEAQAEYYASLLAFEFGYAPFRQFRSNLEVGQHESFDGVVLADRSTWRGTVANYLKGALVVGRLDFEIRAGTDGALSFEDAFRAMNEHDGPIDHRTFVDLVRTVGGEGPAAAADRYAGTDATPDVWSRMAHEETFASADSPVVYGQPETFAVDSEYRATSLGTEPVVVTGENLTATVQVENTASFNTTYEVSMVVDGEDAVTEWGVLEPGETRAVTLSHAFESPGEYELEVLDVARTVTVREPATPAVTGLSLGASTVEPGEAVTVSATVTNDDDVPGERVVEFAVDGRVVATERVRLAPGESTTVRTTIVRSEPGTVTVSGGNETAQLVVVEPTPTATSTATASTTSGVDSPGFTTWSTGLALLAFVVLAARRRW